ncbi:hypothetical protein DXG03_009087 [Asterophora parasitica]|uniref:Uncharacterized protein n=1 Tax=Asterophora parasitica TaxID=117018 RepID=A0A9P7GBA8_9AGAR|nr:hypothetical protein DXG03_009087 [Asterophora parasitica]
MSNAPEQKKSSAPIGAIVGGVVGGVTILAVAVLIAFYLYRKKNQQRPSAAPTKEYLDGPGHNRNMSDFSQRSTGFGQGYQQMDRSYATSPTSHNPTSPTSGTLHTHNDSVNSLSYFGSINHSSVAAYSSPASPPPNSRTLSASPPSNHFAAMITNVNRENIIEPFTLGPSARSNMSPSTDRKRADGAIIPVYDSPNSLPHHISQDPPDLGGASRETTPSRRRVNPPAYSAVDASSQAGSPPRSGLLHSKKGSADTSHSFESNLNGATSVRHGSAVGGGVGSISAIDEVVQMSFGHDQEDMSGTGGTLATGQSQVIPPRTGVFRPMNS